MSATTSCAPSSPRPDGVLQIVPDRGADASSVPLDLRRSRPIIPRSARGRVHAARARRWRAGGVPLKRQWRARLQTDGPCGLEIGDRSAAPRAPLELARSAGDRGGTGGVGHRQRGDDPRRLAGDLSQPPPATARGRYAAPRGRRISRRAGAPRPVRRGGPAHHDHRSRGRPTRDAHRSRRPEHGQHSRFASRRAEEPGAGRASCRSTR